MKKGTKILLIIATILIVSGLIVCVTGAIMANSKNVELLCDKEEDGNAITTHDLTEFALTDCSINVDGVSVKIQGDCESTYVEFININRANYNFTVKNHKLTIKTINPFNFSDIWESYVYNIRENKGGFDGLRHYVFLSKYSDKKPQINIYLSKDTNLTDIAASVNNAGLYVNSIYKNINYTLNAKNGNLTVSKLYSSGSLTASCENGELNFIKANVSEIEFGAQNSPVTVNYNMQINYAVTCAGGTITVDDTDKGSMITELYPATTSASSAGKKAPNTIEGNISGADMIIKNSDNS